MIFLYDSQVCCHPHLRNHSTRVYCEATQYRDTKVSLQCPVDEWIDGILFAIENTKLH